jgi:hypothetical protein
VEAEKMQGKYVGFLLGVLMVLYAVAEFIDYNKSVAPELKQRAINIFERELPGMTIELPQWKDTAPPTLDPASGALGITDTNKYHVIMVSWEKGAPVSDEEAIEATKGFAGKELALVSKEPTEVSGHKAVLLQFSLKGKKDSCLVVWHCERLNRNAFLFIASLMARKELVDFTKRIKDSIVCHKGAN